MLKLKFYVPHQKKDEKIILLLRRHYIVILFRFIFWGVTAVAPILLWAVFGETLSDLFNNQALIPLFTLFLSIYYLYIWLFAFHSFVNYYLDVWIVTTHRIINMEQKGLFSRIVSEQKLYRIQDVTSELKGFWSTIFDFGTVYIQTAGEEPRFIFKQVPGPYSIARKINRLSEENKRYERILDSKAAAKIK